jgi:hexosaminidase
MWSEWIPTTKQMQMQIFPRLAAYAEVGWTTKSEKNYADFILALDELKKRWKLDGISYNEQQEVRE